MAAYASFPERQQLADRGSILIYDEMLVKFEIPSLDVRYEQPVLAG